MFDNLSKQGGENKPIPAQNMNQGGLGTTMDSNKSIPPKVPVLPDLPLKNSGAPSPSKSHVEDIFSSTDSGDSMPKPFGASVQSAPSGSGSGIEEGIPSNIAGLEDRQESGSRKFVVIGIVVVIAIVIFAGLLFVNAMIDKSDKNEVEDELVEDKPVVEDDSVDSEEYGEVDEKLSEEELLGEEPVEEIVEEKEVVEELDIEPIADNKIFDKDNDGLTDEEEKKLGTDVDSPDSDNDGLFDREEVEVYGTDPLDADTDNDGYEDKEEILNGYNPNGDGKLSGFPDIPLSGDNESKEEDLSLIDSDNDGLSDEEEINTYKTDPLNNDTDGDTYTDGDEVKNGYNPLGVGKL